MVHSLTEARRAQTATAANSFSRLRLSAAEFA
jgi:hypothetical protein